MRSNTRVPIIYLGQLLIISAHLKLRRFLQTVCDELQIIKADKLGKNWNSVSALVVMRVIDCIQRWSMSTMTSTELLSGDSSARALFVAVVIAVLLISSSSASNISTAVTPSNGTSTTKSSTTSTLPPTEVQSSEDSMSTGLRGLYNMAEIFLDVVQPPGKKNLYDELKVEAGKRKETVSQSISASLPNSRDLIFALGLLVV